MKLDIIKLEKWRIPVFVKKFRWAQYESFNGLLTFCKNNTFGKNLFLELWSKNLKANQNAGFIKLKYLTNKLRYEDEFSDLTRGP